MTVSFVGIFHDLAQLVAHGSVTLVLAERLLLFFCVLLIFTKITSTIRFNQLSAKSRQGQPVIPVVPYWVPGIYHLIPFLRNTAEFPEQLTKQYGWERPIRFKAAGETFTVVANPQHITAIYKNSRFLSARSITERAAKYIVGVPSHIIPFYQADDSGMAAEVRKGSKVTQENRILYHQVHTGQKFLASPYLEPLIQRYMTMFRDHIQALEIGTDWVECPDLYRFCQIASAQATIEATMGSKILDLNPNLVEDFWAAKDSAPEYYRGLPRWVAPQIYKARDRVIKAIEKWHDFAFAHGDHTNTASHDPDWDPVWGSKYVKVREQYMLSMKPLTAHVRAAEDWGFMANGNTPPVIFWYLFEALRDPELAERLMEEVIPCVLEGGDMDISKLASQPLLQSVYAEVLRLRVSILISRMVEYQDISFDGYTVPRGEYILMPTDTVHFNEEAWTQAGWRPKIPLRQFDATRFLVPSDGGLQFNQDGLGYLWVPFGGGDRMCPGRHVAKLEMIFSFAFLFFNYDIELMPIDVGKVQCNTKYAAFGTLPPTSPVPFRIRKKMRGSRTSR
ncbi:cytochrome P450 [Nemania sp. FL0031]|nr:cytochrome P450 [Nemania sp. FL0031]